jgi:hypothetical protein
MQINLSLKYYLNEILKAPLRPLTNSTKSKKIHINRSASGSIRCFAGGAKRVLNGITVILRETSFYLEIACRLRLFQGKPWFSSNP